MIVSDTSPLSALAKMDWLEWLPRRWTHVLIPRAVWQELQGIGDEAALQRLQDARTGGWLEVADVADAAMVAGLRGFLDLGESEALVLARERNAGVVMVDELDGRNAAVELGLRVTGTLGLLAWAKLSGLIPSAELAMRELEARTRFFISDPVRLTVLQRSGERA